MDWGKHKSTWPHAEHSAFVLSKPHKWFVQEFGSGPELLLIHGAGGSTQSFRHLAPILAKSFHVILIDLPGQGFTKAGSQSRFGLDTMAEDIWVLIEDQTWAPSAIIGHSAGGAIALEIVRRTQLECPVIGINAALSPFKGIAGLLFPMMAKVMARTPFIANMFTASSNRPGSINRLIKGTGSQLGEADLQYYRALIGDIGHVNGTLKMMAQWDLDPLSQNLGTIASPVHLIVGEDDKAVPPKTASDVCRELADCTIKSFNGLGHLIHEEAPEKTASEIIDYLSRQ